MSPSSPRTAIPAAILLIATVFMIAAAPRAVAPVPAHAATPTLMLAEANLCEARTGRDRDDCIDEAQGKELILRAERAASLDVREEGSPIAEEAAADARHPPRSALR